MKKHKKYRLNKAKFAAFLVIVAIAIVAIAIFANIVYMMYAFPEKIFTTHPNFIGW